VRIGIDQKDPRILPDMGVRVSFLEAADAARTGAASGVAAGVLVPASAVVERDGRSVVFVLETGHAHARTVRPGATAADLRQVEGLAGGTVMVRAPPPELQDGAAVAIRKQ
jgi:hypothetical protein